MPSVPGPSPRCAGVSNNTSVPRPVAAGGAGACSMSGNPWVHVPVDPPYVLLEDARAVGEFNASAGEAHQLQINKLLPEPFVGDPAAPVLLLSNNPGFGERSLLRQQ